MNEIEKKIFEKRKKIENDLLIEIVLGQDEHDGDVNEMDQRNKEFLMDNFFKIYDRPPLENGVDNEIESNYQQRSPNRSIKNSPQLRRKTINRKMSILKKIRATNFFVDDN